MQNRKKWFAIPAIVLALAIIAGVVYGVVFNGAVFNAGVDFTGGYAITVSIGAGLDNEETRADYEERITDVTLPMKSHNFGEWEKKAVWKSVPRENADKFSAGTCAGRNPLRGCAKKIPYANKTQNSSA